MNKTTGIAIGLVVLLLVTGGIVFAVLRRPKSTTTPQPAEQAEAETGILPPVDESVKVDVEKSTAKDNTIVLTVRGMASKMSSVAYEVTYDSQGLIKGVNSGSKPIDTAGQDTFEREVYLGTCSKNVCKPDAGVSAVSVVLEFTDTAGKRSQFSREYPL